VLNAGIPGWGMKDYYIFLRERGMDYNPDVVVVALTSSDLISRERNDRIFEKVRERLRSEGKLLNLTDFRRHQVIEGHAKSRVRKIVNRILKNRSTLRNSSFAEYFHRTLNLLKRHDVKPYFYGVSGLQAEVQSFLGEHGNSDNIVVMYLPEEMQYNPWKYRISSLDVHPDSEGHKLLAEKLYRKIVDSRNTSRQRM
ncbi:MAG: SGNH/GDSL hydrolase family protein, partial [Candidatus Aenigmatarchaeota archaeon]